MHKYTFDTPEQLKEFVDLVNLEPDSLAISVKKTGSTTAEVSSPTRGGTLKAATLYSRVKNPKKAPKSDEPTTTRVFKFETSPMKGEFMLQAQRIAGVKTRGTGTLSVEATYPKSVEGLLIQLWDKASGV